ncbi:MAG: CpsB/CapC family capsule biosynthesis tyrosine phosphatase [Chitinophagales bacterium]|nr:CpsB/CapC family capsule biosynthesis tyrosine phosphatase [Chitinophagales bacterium]
MMGWFRRRKSPPADQPAVVPLQTDLHSHLLIGVDDGARSETEALNMVRGLAELGFRKAITTPHVYHDIYPNSPQVIHSALDRLQRLLADHQIAFIVEAAAEYFLDEFFLRLLDQRSLLTFGRQYVLFELPYHSRPAMLEEAVFQLQLAGYQPVLAHPERYPYLFDPRLNLYDDLKKSGVLFQLNLASLTGHFGSGPRRAARALSQAGWIDFAGTDLHQAASCLVLHETMRQREYVELLARNPLRNNEL